MIEARNLTKRFGTRNVLDGLDFEVGAGERVALLGLNGAGKTTLLRCAMGVLSFDGNLSIDGLDVGRAGRRARERIGYVPQRPPLFPMTLEATVEFFAAIRGVAPAAIEERLHQLGLPLESTGDLMVGELSGGMLQKALLAIALASRPRVLLLDEPTANLDPRARAEFLRALRAVDGGTTVLLASHRLEEIETVADRVWILHSGRIVFDGSLDGLRDTAGAESWLWVRTTPDQRDAVRARFVRRAGEAAVLANGTQVAVQLSPEARVEALSEISAADLTIRDFWVTGPSLEEIVEEFFGRGAG